jgi:MerR family transcriptional regulator, copper efflux regulator
MSATKLMKPGDRPHLLRVGDLAKLTGKTVRAIHLYEEVGLLTPSTRTSGGFRLYDSGAVDRVRWIDLLHTAGFSLQEMGEVLRSWWDADLGPQAMERLRALFEAKLAETREAIHRQQRLERELLDGLAYLQTCRQCGVQETAVGCVHCGVDHGMSDEPALVAGIKSRPERSARPTSRRSAFVPLHEVDRPR